MRQLFAILVFAALTAHAMDAGEPLRGYTVEASATEAQWERKFREMPDPERLRRTMERLAARPHNAGSPYDKDNAEWLLAQLKSYGLEAQIEQFDALVPTPKLRLLELNGPAKYTAKLEEPTLAVDPTSGQKQEQLPTYNAYSHDGDVTAPLVYVNYGAPEDYEQLERLGVSVRGAIVIARYGKTWRGIKPKVAADHGAVGCIIYSDPRDDGYYDGGQYPEGGMRPAEGVQRGSVMDMPIYPGDPQTPGEGAVPGAKLIPLDQVKVITRIPVLPISYTDAKPFLEALQGPVAPENWRGALPFTYRVGPSAVTAHLAVQSNWDRKPLYDVIARIPGTRHPDQWVIRGNHHDAWVNGADDPVAGTSPELEEARALGQLLQQGWRPARTIVYCFWDGEEFGLLGSTEWAEAHAEELRRHAVAYINSDGNERGYLQAEGSHSLENFVNGVAKDIIDPETNMSVWERLRLVRLSKAAPGKRAELRSRPDLRIGALGSGSDYTVFIDHLGVPSVDIGYGGEDKGTQYHSIYDDIYFYEHFEDTTFVYGRALAQTAGTMAMRLADADILPMQFTDLAETVRGYVTEVKTLADSEREAAMERNTEISEGVYRALYDPKKKMVPPQPEPVPPYLNFAPLDQASADLTQAAAEYEAAYGKWSGNAPTGLNAKLMQTGEALTDPQGLPSRPWYENLIYAPGFYTGYEVKTLPGVREAIEQKQWTTANTEIERTAAALEREVDLLHSATLLLQK
jgi:N-acetylated-alpha-linked acidic dipeptidase